MIHFTIFLELAWVNDCDDEYSFVLAYRNGPIGLFLGMKRCPKKKKKKYSLSDNRKIESAKESFFFKQVLR